MKSAFVSKDSCHLSSANDGKPVKLKSWNVFSYNQYNSRSLFSGAGWPKLLFNGQKLIKRPLLDLERMMIRSVRENLTGGQRLNDQEIALKICGQRGEKSDPPCSPVLTRITEKHLLPRGLRLATFGPNPWGPATIVHCGQATFFACRVLSDRLMCL